MECAGADKKAADVYPHGKMNLDDLRGGHRRYQGTDLYRTLESIRSRMATAPHRQGLFARAEAGHLGLAARLRKRRVRRHGAGGWHGPEDILRLYDEQRGRCFYCGTELNGRYQVEYKTPLARGGTDWPENLCCACEYCASHKQNRTEEEFKAYLAGLRRRSC
ncbi:MAG: HNH endonuclease [Actinomycetia bacterium]|nr:HNH endonuclease [Actinomycetes bacterium]